MTARLLRSTAPERWPQHTGSPTTSFGFNVRGNFAPGESLTWGNAGSCRGYGGGPGDCNGVADQRSSLRHARLRLASPARPRGARMTTGRSPPATSTRTATGRLKGVVTYSETSDASAGRSRRRQSRIHAGEHLSAAQSLGLVCATAPTVISIRTSIRSTTLRPTLGTSRAACALA